MVNILAMGRPASSGKSPRKSKTAQTKRRRPKEKEVATKKVKQASKAGTTAKKPSRTRAKSLEQRKVDTKRVWPWPITHPNDERALLEGCYTDFEAAEKVRHFYKDLLVLPKEGGGTKPFHLLDWWYRDVIAPLFGWKRPDGRRRFDKGFITTAKKSGKSTVLAGLPLYMILADNEEEAEAYATAVDRDQASIIFAKTLRCVRLSPTLNKVLHCLESLKRIKYEARGGLFEAISSDADSTEGKNPHLLLADEVHVWRDRAFFNSLMYGDIARSQPLFLMITTAGDDFTTIGFEEYEFAKDLLNPNNDFYSQSHFAFIAEASPERSWDDPEGWLEAQPSLRPAVDTFRAKDSDEPTEIRTIGSLDKLQVRCDEAKQSPRKQREFQRYICNRWIAGVEDVWLDYDQWVRGSGPVEDHLGEACWGGLDLSSSRALSSLCLAFWEGDVLDLRWWFWTPEDRIREHEHKWRVPLRDWVQAGHITPSPGEAISYALIRAKISGVTPDGECLDTAVAKSYKIKSIGYDPWNAQKLSEEELYNYDGIPMEPFRQGFHSFNAPCKEFERLLAQGQIRHGGNPVVDWMVRHCIVDKDPAGNIKPNKTKSRMMIDGVVTAVMACGLAVRDKGTKDPWERYVGQGIRTL